jgi:uncharacterized protein
MQHRPRIYDAILKQHLIQNRQMALVSGPRQVGKTTSCRSLSDCYLNWDNRDDRQIIVHGPNALATHLGLERLKDKPPVVILDELHKYSKWKQVLKGFYDTFGAKSRMLVTGSSRLDVFRRGSDSLMGRYFLYRIHPWSVAECIHADDVPDALLRPPKAVAEEDWIALWEHGGFPEPFLRRDIRFTRRWATLRHDQMAKEDLRDVTRVQDLGTLEILMHLLESRSGQQLIYSNLAREIGVSIETIRRWIDLLVRMHFGFVIRPWFRNVSKSLLKEPKWFLRDWSGLSDVGARAETFVACHLLKAVEGWNDLGLGKFELRYLRDKLKREVDFVIVRDGTPWVLVEVKHSDTSLLPSLGHFQKETKAEHALQVVIDLPFVAADSLSSTGPIVVPARTFLSQLL